MDSATDPEFFDNHTHRMHEPLAAFNQAFPSEQQNHPTAQSIDKPRYVPWPPGLIQPWSPEVLNCEQIERSPVAQELLYEPAMDVRPQAPALQHSDMPFSSRDFVKELDQDGIFGSDAQLVDGSLPENNIDPPPPPDPVGPPTQMASRNGRLSRKTSNAERVGGRRHQPLNSHSRQNAKMIRQAQGQCWSCILQRNPV